MIHSNRLYAENELQAVEQLHILGCTDGLPVIVPLLDRVERMVLAGGLDPDLVVGELGPNMGAATTGKGTQVLVLNPEHANALASAGYNRQGIQQTLHERAGNTWAELSAVHGGPGEYPGAFIRSIPGPEYLLVLVAGGPGVYSSVMPSWGGGSHGNISVTKKIELHQKCEIPWVKNE
jgi:hypothetical protein